MGDAVVMKVEGLQGVYEMLRSLPAEVVSKKGGPVKRILRRAALLIHAAEKANLQKVTAKAADADTRYSTGLLIENLIVSRGKAPADGKGERQLVRVRRKTYPDRTGKPVTTLKTAQILEYGSEKQDAEPWIRPAFLEQAPKAIELIERELPREIERIAKRLAKEKGRR